MKYNFRGVWIIMIYLYPHCITNSRTEGKYNCCCHSVDGNSRAVCGKCFITFIIIFRDSTECLAVDTSSETNLLDATSDMHINN